MTASGGPRARGERGQVGRRRFRWLLGLFLAGAGAFLVANIFQSWTELQGLRDQVTGYPWRLSVGWMVGAALFWTVALLASAAVWVWLYRGAGRTLGFWAGVLAWRVASFGRYIPGKLWQLTGLAAYLRQRGGSGAGAVSSSLQLQILTLLAGLALTAAFLGGGLASFSRPGWQVLVLVLGLVVLLQPRIIGGISRRLGRWLGEEIGSEEARFSVQAPAGIALTGVWLTYGLGFMLFLRGVAGVELSLGQATGVFAASYIAGFAVLVAPAGLVAREAAMAALLVALTPLPTAVAATLALAARLVVTAAELLSLGLAWLLVRWYGAGVSKDTIGNAPLSRRGVGPKGLE